MDRIKESFDSLPIAACFFDKNGVVRLINRRMLRHCKLAAKRRYTVAGRDAKRSAGAAAKRVLSGSAPSDLPFSGRNSAALSQEQITTKAGSDIRKSLPQTLRS